MNPAGISPGGFFHYNDRAMQTDKEKGERRKEKGERRGIRVIAFHTEL
jgi:hypothetical protein